MSQSINESIFPPEPFKEERKELLFEHLDSQAHGGQRQRESSPELDGVLFGREQPGAVSAFGGGPNPGDVSGAVAMVVSKNERLLGKKVQLRQPRGEGFGNGHSADRHEGSMREGRKLDWRAGLVPQTLGPDARREDRS